MAKRPICVKCNKKKKATEFYASPGKKDGLDATCKECRKKLNRINRRLKIDYYREYDRNRSNLPHRVEARDEYIKTDNGKKARLNANKDYLNRNESIRNARSVLARVIRNNRIVKPDICSECGSDEKIEGHHCDYTKPLQVMWLCEKCHKEWHRNNTPIYE